MSASEQTDADLLAAHVDGDPEAFGRLFARHRDRLWAVALRTAGNPDDAADALQDAMISAFRRAASFRGQSSVTTWLHRIVVNACLDRHRHLKVRAASPLPDDLDRTPSATTAPEHAQPADPADAAVDSERRRRVLTALATLPPEHRAALVLVDMEGYSVAEVAAILNCPPGTVKSRCSRGRAKLRALLADDLGDGLADGDGGGGGDGAAAPPGNPPPPSTVPSLEIPPPATSTSPGGGAP
ncbi:RNA polymerase sigma factor SigM [Nocardioides jishulii]|uniref:RNA polymerase sigma factor SigM n=1 Tax=Nocardioides jishulii TaxID=2575440 RepID=A0A4U2YSI7_9ACTN|nr:RNA polymerase sigma factor SigM [Nocardioides jishulii]QCX28989.1 RNA polymerase sigma factor SigM [Nocardioides jishulii]TKI64110.1 RNA polymerase sigma factor SigM [Nocardioides jishulii]